MKKLFVLLICFLVMAVGCATNPIVTTNKYDSHWTGEFTTENIRASGKTRLHFRVYNGQFEKTVYYGYKIRGYGTKQIPIKISGYFTENGLKIPSAYGNIIIESVAVRLILKFEVTHFDGKTASGTWTTHTNMRGWSSSGVWNMRRL